MHRVVIRRVIAIAAALALSVLGGAVALVLSAGPSGAAATTAASTSWFHDPISKSVRAKEIAVPKRPASYHGPLRHTKADRRTHGGSVAVPVAWARGHQLSDGQAVVLNGAGLFGFDSPTPSAAAKKQLTRLDSSLTTVTRIVCEGYTDYGGHSAHEKSLGKKRAAAACALIRSHSSTVRTAAVSYGNTRPVVVGSTHRDRAENRRVVIFITKAGPRVPSAPTLTAATPDSGSASLSFTRPATDGGSRVTGYQVSTGGAWTALATSGTSTLTAHLAGLINNTTYSVRVRAINAVGHGPASNSRSVTPTDGTPGPPNITSLTVDYVTNGPSAALLNFTFTNAAPNGSPLTGYQWTQDGEHWFNLGWTAGTPNTAALNVSWNCVPDVDSVTIRGVNAVGPGAASNTRSLTLDSC